MLKSQADGIITNRRLFFMETTQSTKSEPTLSVCLIVRNEEANLPACLQSLNQLGHQTVVIDTGSTDRTREIAHRHQAQVFNFPWQNDFSAARNHAIEKATGDWILFIDADDRLPAASHQAIKNAIAQAPDHIWGYIGTYQKVNPDSAAPSLHDDYTLKCRLFRNRPELRYQGLVHEYLPLDQHPNHFTIAERLVIEHHKTPVAAQESLARNIEILTAAYHQDRKNPRYLYYLGSSHKCLGNPKLAIKFLKKHLKCKDIDHEDRWHTTLQIAESYAQLKNIRAYLKWCDRAIKIDRRHVEPYLYLGDYCLEEGDYEKAQTFYEQASRLKIPHTKHTVNQLLYSFYPFLALATVNINQGNHFCAEQYLRQAEKAVPHHQKIRELRQIISSATKTTS